MGIIQFFLSLHDPINVNSINNRVSIKVYPEDCVTKKKIENKMCW